MTDGSPLVSICKSLARVKAEIVGMDVRVSLIEKDDEEDKGGQAGRLAICF